MMAVDGAAPVDGLAKWGEGVEGQDLAN